MASLSPSRKALLLLLLVAAVLLITESIRQNRPPQTEQPPDFRLYPAGEQRKRAFIGYLGPLVDATNARWQARRDRLARLSGAP